MPFLHTKSSNITLPKEENYISKSADKIIKQLHTVTNIYKAICLIINLYDWQLIQHTCFKGAYQDNKFKHLRKRATHSHHLEIHTNYQEMSLLHQRLWTIKEVHKTHDKAACGMHNPLRKIFSTERHIKEQKGSIRKRLVANTILLVKPNPGFNMRFVLILCHCINRDNKQHEAQKHPYHIFNQIKQI